VSVSAWCCRKSSAGEEKREENRTNLGRRPIQLRKDRSIVPLEHCPDLSVQMRERELLDRFVVIAVAVLVLLFFFLVFGIAQLAHSVSPDGRKLRFSTPTRLLRPPRPTRELRTHPIGPLPSGMNNPSLSSHSRKSSSLGMGRMTTAFGECRLKSGYQEENWQARTEEVVRGEKR
jgi:hypothetical protein